MHAGRYGFAQVPKNLPPLHVEIFTRKACRCAYRLPDDCPGGELLELYEKLREAVVRALEVSACRAKLSCDMQTAQARLLAQGVSGITTTGMMNGAIELVSAFCLASRTAYWPDDISMNVQFISWC